MRPILERYTSRKFLFALAAAIVAFLSALFPDIPEESVKYVVLAAMGYVGFEGLVDASYAIGKWWSEKSAKAPVEVEGK